MHHKNFELGKRYARADGRIVTIASRWEYTTQKTGDIGALVIGDDNIERWDDPSPGFGFCTSITDVSKRLLLGAIPAGKTTTGPLKIR